ncbi:MAG: thiamine pyrophosphate-binding protein [Salinirussus sp.]
MKGRTRLIELIDEAGIQTIFTLMSEDTMRMMSEIDNDWPGIEMVQTRHEQCAVSMADGFARATDEIGVALVGRGPAIAQAGTGMVTARKKGSDVLVIVPTMPIFGTHDQKDFPQEDYLHNTIGEVAAVRSHETLVEVAREAIRQVRVGEGPLALQIPWDLLDSNMREDQLGSEPTVDVGDTAPGSVEPDSAAIEKAVDMYIDSAAFQPPVILAGRGAVQAGAKDAIEEFARRTSALLATSLQGRNYFQDHPFYLGFTGEWGHDIANKYAAESQLVFAVGASLNPYTTDEGHVFGEEGKVVHIDADLGNIERYTDVDLGIHGDAKHTIEALNEALEHEGIDRDGELWTDDLRREIEEFDRLGDRDFDDVPGTMDPRDLMRTLNDLLPEDRKIVTGAGHHTRWVLDGIDVHPADFTFPLDFASIGLGLPMGIGTAVSTPDRPTAVITGDAGLTMSIQEFDTMVREDVPLTVVVVNDDSLGSEYHSMEAGGVDGSVSLVDSPDFASVAESFGADGYTATSITELEELSDVLGSHEGQQVIDCKVNYKVRHRSKM